MGNTFYGDERVWTAALALGDREVSRASAHSLRVALGLPCSPWLVDDVMDAARQSGATQIDWLMRHAPLRTDGTPRPDSMAYRALAWWVQRYAEAEQQMQVQENPLLQLYLDPNGAAQRQQRVNQQQAQFKAVIEEALIPGNQRYTLRDLKAVQLAMPIYRQLVEWGAGWDKAAAVGSAPHSRSQNAGQEALCRTMRSYQELLLFP